jgi:hypothetical protein
LFSLGFQSEKCSNKKIKETPMNDQILSIKVTCRNNEQCLFEEKDIFLDIKIFNNTDSEIGFPLEFAKDKGPITRLIDTRTKADTFIPTHPPDGDLRDKFTTVKPGEFISMEWIVTADEFRQFSNDVDLSVEITLMADILVKGKKVAFRGSDTRRVISKNRPVS